MDEVQLKIIPAPSQSPILAAEPFSAEQKGKGKSVPSPEAADVGGVPPLPPRRTATENSVSTHRQFLNQEIALSEISYEIKNIKFGAETIPIVLQTTNGACPILSIANFLSLSSAKLDLPNDKPCISANHLTELLAEYMLNHGTDLTHLGALEGLHRGLNVNPKFTGVDQFLEGSEIIHTFGGTLLHGWIPDTEKFHLTPSYDNFEAAQVHILTDPEAEASIMINMFFETYPNNMTPQGLSSLQSFLKEGEMAILFYNAHFSLLYKHPESGDLYCLVTDAGYSSSGNDVVWESLTLDHEGTQFYSADFIPRVVLGEAKNEDAFGLALDDDDEDAQLARRLQAEENNDVHESDSAMAMRLQQIQLDQDADRARDARRQERIDDQSRVDTYNGVHNEIQDQTIQSIGRKKKKECTVM